ncbi:class I SAM-dependent methyltransferase [Gracilibacillus sp. S3-1-1]|uniref:Class I SAM-dependent methyltransferase n=1 Tax=Gracilibacillus pellucidus TaxID=3095368 RepID=A0ACC6M465_9BACI|nr:class I SAM-dependent methyltransferase [Gracilibacillus sp. S3-1-1]MDX8045602.1 class I SAM-dependent methyltransferase [Gracilibacillus sp. S3-1-1]
MKEKITETFNQLAKVYEHNIDTDSLHNSEYERPAMLELLPNNLENKRVLDAGCAAGWYTEQLIDRGARVVAIDVSPDMVHATKRRVDKKAEIHCHDLTEPLPFENDSFDMVISSLTLHYLKDWHPTFQEFQRILKREGTLLFSVHHPASDIHLLQNGNYFSTELIIDQWHKDGKLYEVPFYHRPLTEIINQTSTYFAMEKLMEPQPTRKLQEQASETYQQLMKSPDFLIIKATSTL